MCLAYSPDGVGKNNGKGYYMYAKGSKPKPDPSVLPMMEESRKLTNVIPNGKVRKQIDRISLLINFISCECLIKPFCSQFLRQTKKF